MLEIEQKREKRENYVRVLSFDVGIKNLSYCLLDILKQEHAESSPSSTFSSSSPSFVSSRIVTHEILSWGIIDLTQNMPAQLQTPPVGPPKRLRGPSCEHCRKAAKYYHPPSHASYVCADHVANCTNYFLPSFLPCKLKTKSMFEILELINSPSHLPLKKYIFSILNISFSSSLPLLYSHIHISKAKLIQHITTSCEQFSLSLYIPSLSFSSSSSTSPSPSPSPSPSTLTKEEEKKENVNACEMDLITVARNLKPQFEFFFPSFVKENLDYVLIENQMMNRMKTIQGMITYYFVEHCSPSLEIHYVSATQKLKLFSKPSSSSSASLASSVSIPEISFSSSPLLSVSASSAISDSTYLDDSDKEEEETDSNAEEEDDEEDEDVEEENEEPIRIAKGKRKASPTTTSTTRNLTKEDEKRKKQEYRQRKKDAIIHCLEMVDSKWKAFFLKHKKKDDLADSYLQSLAFFHNFSSSSPSFVNDKRKKKELKK